VDALSPTTIQNLIQVYGLWVLFPVVMLEGMGIPVPGETALLATAVYAGSTDKISIVPVVLIAATAAMVGDNIGYFIGLRLVVRYGRYVRLNESRLKIGWYLFLRHGG
jgi:membrane protein DedA with SNARE-associated domain